MSKSTGTFVRFYPPVWERIKDAKNRNFSINYAVGNYAGLPDELIMAYGRGENEIEEDKPEGKK